MEWAKRTVTTSGLSPSARYGEYPPAHTSSLFFGSVSLLIHTIYRVPRVSYVSNLWVWSARI